jgi:dolichol-phosphate mannosyltransferase
MASSEMVGKDLTIILPTYNEAENIAPMIEALSVSYPGAQILIVDDNSNDGTVDRARSVSAAIPPRVIVRDPQDRGLTASVMDGIMNAKTEYFVVMDADFQHPPRYVGTMVSALREDKDLVIGVREEKLSMLYSRQFASSGAHLLARTFLRAKRQPVSDDTMSGFFGGRTDSCQKIIVDHGHSFERRGFKILFDLLRFAPRDIRMDEIRFKFDARRSGESKLNSDIILSIIRQCGIPGKMFATCVSFFLMTVLGRFLAAMLLGIVSSLSIILMNGTISYSVYINTIFSLVLAISSMFIVNEVVARYGKRRGIDYGLLILCLVSLAYLVNLSTFRLLDQEVSVILAAAAVLGLLVAFGYEFIGSHIPKPTA